MHFKLALVLTWQKYFMFVTTFVSIPVKKSWWHFLYNAHTTYTDWSTVAKKTVLAKMDHIWNGKIKFLRVGSKCNDVSNTHGVSNIGCWHHIFREREPYKLPFFMPRFIISEQLTEWVNENPFCWLFLNASLVYMWTVHFIRVSETAL